MLWSGAFVAVRAGLPDVSALTFLAARFTVASLVLVGFTLAWRAARADWQAIGRLWPHLVVAGVLINGAYLSAGYLAMTQIKGAMMALVGALAPVLTALISSRLGERFRPVQWLGFGLGFVGVVVVVGAELDTGALKSSATWVGLGWAVCSLLSIVAGTLYFNRHAKAAPLLVSNAVQLGAGALFCWLLVAGFETPRVNLTWGAALTFAYLTFAVSLGAMAIYLYMLKRETAGRAIANLYLTPGVTALLGWAVLDERFAVTAIAGFAISMLGLWLVNRPAK